MKVAEITPGYTVFVYLLPELFRHRKKISYVLHVRYVTHFHDMCVCVCVYDFFHSVCRHWFVVFCYFFTK